VIPAENPKWRQNDIPRRRNSNGSEGGPYVLHPGSKRTYGDKKCETCGRQVEPDKKHPRKGKCRCVYYQRTTTFIDVIEDEYLLKKWGNRNVAWGMGQRRDLQLAAATCKPDSDKSQPLEDKTELNKIAKEAQSEAGDKQKASIGTSLHKLTHMKDRGETLGYVPPEWVDDLKAYDEATKGIEWIAIETFRVLDDWVDKSCTHIHPRNKLFDPEHPCRCRGVAGTVDRIGWIRGRLVIADIKGLDLRTVLPTPTGWTTMGAVRVGDQVLDENGRPCNVTIKSGSKRIGTFVVSFDDGTKVTCDSEHIWWTQTAHDRRTNRPPQARSVLDVIATLRYNGQANHSVPVAKSLDLPSARLPIAPYLLGAWLGDGHHMRNCITKQDDLFDILTADGHALGKRQVDKRNGCITRTVPDLNDVLEDWNLLGNRHIPDRYMRSSHTQRLRLLQGLMDTDGTWNTARRRALFTSTNKVLAHQVYDLLITLGQRPHIGEISRTGYGKTVTSYDVEFLPNGIDPFRLPRKAAKATAQKPVPTTRAGRRLIVSIEPGPNVETACIGVDSPNNVYLCSENMIPTHNTGKLFGEPGKAMQLAMYQKMIPYDIATDTRGVDAKPVDPNIGYIIHLPEGEGRCDILPIHIGMGWGACKVAKQVWDIRDQKFFMDESQIVVGRTLIDMARQAGSIQECKILWKNSKAMGELTTEVADALKARVTELGGKVKAG
jgi:hypothetical protein